MENNNKTAVIDIISITKKLFRHKKTFAITIPIAMVLSVLYIICIPRYYSTDTKLAPEVENAMGGSTLGSIASSFGIDISDMKSSDAITPLLYPDLMKDNKFIASLFYLRVKSADGKIDCPYYEYLSKNQKEPWWAELFRKKDDKSKEIPGKDLNPYYLNKEQDKIADAIKKSITLSVDSKNGVITITTSAQDPLICKTLADSVRIKLQSFITTYRTNKAREDVIYYRKLMQEAKHSYEKARQIYGTYADANTDVVLESFRSKQEDLENDMQLKFNTYSALNTQYQSAVAKVQEKTPAFTILKGASVPIKPAGPKRMIFVAIMTMIAFIVTSFWLLRKDLKKLFA